MRAFSTADSLRAVVEQCFAALPNRVVHPGEAWNHARKMKTGFGTVESAMTFALKGVETRNGRQLASLTVAGKNTVTMDPNAGANLPNPMAMSVSMGSATSQGELLVDVKTGRLHRSSVQSMRADERRITAPDGSAINVDAVTKTTHTVELVEK